MGIFDKIFKSEASKELSTVIETTDMIANLYLKFRETYPKKSNSEIFKEIIKLRYSTMPLEDEDAYNRLLSGTEYFSLSMLINNIIFAETDTSGMPANTISRLLKNTSEVIEERLKKYNL